MKDSPVLHLKVLMILRGAACTVTSVLLV